MTSLQDQTDIIGSNTLSIISEAHQFNQWMYEQVKPYLHGVVLELGSGIGNISRLVLDDRFSTVLSDVNPVYTQKLKTLFAGYSNLMQVVSIDLQLSDFEKKYEAMQEKFDSVFLLNVIEHLKDDHRAIKNCKFLLKPGGTLVALAPAYQYLYCELDKNLGHYRRYTSKSLAALFIGNKMHLIKKKYFNVAGLSGWFILGKLLRAPQLQSGSFNLFNKSVPLFRLADKLICNRMGLSAIVVAKR